MGMWQKHNRSLKKREQSEEPEEMKENSTPTGDNPADYALWKMLQSGQLSRYNFESRKRILGTVVSFYCRSAKLVIDLEEPNHKIRQREENESDILMQKSGIKVLRFNRDAVLDRPNSVRNSILEELADIEAPDQQ